MSTSKTSNYQLNQWVKSDRVLMSEFNADNAKIDAALKSHDTSLASKASTSALNSLKTTVNTKASQSEVNTLSQSLTQASELRNCRVVTGSYTGAGTYGPSHPNTLTFTHKPVFLCVTAATTKDLMLLARNQPSTVGLTGSSAPFLDVRWTDKSVSWNASDALSTTAGPSAQLNHSAVTYYYFAALEVA